LVEYVRYLESFVEAYTQREAFDQAITHRPDELSPALWRKLGW